jgi:hypothetical protein
MDKLDIHDIAGLTRYAIAHGVVECSGGIRSSGGIAEEYSPGGRTSGAAIRLLAAPVHP